SFQETVVSSYWAVKLDSPIRIENNSESAVPRSRALKSLWLFHDSIVGRRLYLEVPAWHHSVFHCNNDAVRMEHVLWFFDKARCSKWHIIGHANGKNAVRCIEQRSTILALWCYHTNRRGGFSLSVFTSLSHRRVHSTAVARSKTSRLGTS